MLIAVKEGVTVFRGGTIFEVGEPVVIKRPNGTAEERVQLPDDGMGRAIMVEMKDVIVCGETELHSAEAGHGRCYFSREEILHPLQHAYPHDFSPRSISFEKSNEGWQMKWRIPRNSNPKVECLFVNKLTNETIPAEAECKQLEFNETQISTVDYKQTIRKRMALHYLWDLNKLKPGCYSAEVDLGDNFRGRVHFIKHFPQQLSHRDPRETSEVAEVQFSDELWNTALGLKLAWGPKSRIPFQVRLLELFPELKWAQANYLEKICNETLSFAWVAYEKEVDRSIPDARGELIKSYPWIDDTQHAQLKVLGEYYARLKR